METNHPSHNDKNTKNSKQKNMVWKMKRRSSREQAKEASSLIREHLNNSSKIKSCTKREFDHSSQNSSQTSSSINCCDQSTLRDQSTRSGRSIGSRSGNIRFSGNSRGSGSSAGRGIETPAGEQDSCTSGSNISRASSARASQRSKTSQLSLPIGKAVCFSEIHIRDYERVVGDNPSCSAGPPIGIGWAHGGTRILNVNKYEQARPYRKSQKGMVLTREEREEILLNWGASFHDIIESIRTNIRVKNQRRQTVTNLGKVQRLEEAFESATRKLKRTLLLRRRTGEKVKELQNQANLASSALTSLMIAEDNVLNDIRADVAPTGHEPEQDDLENLEVEVNVSDFCRKSPLETKLHRLPSNISENDASTISGFTLGNSTTASVLEMEKFYRDLELEMFGDTDVPDMVGQTLEVPGLEIPEEERVYTEPPAVPCYPVDDGSFIFQSAPVSNGRTPNGMDHSDALHHHIHDVQGRSMLSRSLDDYDCCPSGHPPPPYGLYPPQQLPYHVPEGERIPTNYQFANARLSSSWDSPDAMGAQALRSIYALEQQYASAYAPPGPPPSAIGNPRYPPSNGRYEYPRKNGRLRHRSARDGPQIRHLPPPTHLTPTHWMEAHDDSIGARRGYGSEPIIITEESYERGNRNFMGSDQPYVYPASYDAYHNHIHTQQFPPSFY